MAGEGTLYNITDVSDGGIWNTGSDEGITPDMVLPSQGGGDNYQRSYADEAKDRWGEYRRRRQELEDNYPVYKRILGGIGEAMQSYGQGRPAVKPQTPGLNELNAEFADITGQAREENRAQNAFKREEMKANTGMRREILKGRMTENVQRMKNEAMLKAVNARIKAAVAANNGKPLTSDQYMTILLQNYAQAGGFGTDPTSVTSLNMLLNTLGSLRGQAAAGNREIMGSPPIVPMPAGSGPAPAATPAPAKKTGGILGVLDSITGRKSAAASSATPSTPEEAKAAGWKLHTVNGRSGYVDPTGEYVIPVQ